MDCVPAPYAVEDTTTVDDELAEADDETEDELPDPVGLLLLLEGGTDDKGGSGAVGPSLSDTILVAFVAAELLAMPPPPPPAPRPDASLLDALRMPK